MADIREMLKVMGQIEGQFRHHGMWLNPYIPPPKIAIRDDWDEKSQLAAQLLNRIFWVRSMPDCSRLFGPVRESAVDAFLHDYSTGDERVDYARNQLNLLIADIAMVPRIDVSAFSRIEE